MHQQTHQPAAAAAAAAAAWSMVGRRRRAAAARAVIDDVCFTGPRCACVHFCKPLSSFIFQGCCVHCAISANLWVGRLWSEGASRRCARQDFCDVRTVFLYCKMALLRQFLWNCCACAADSKEAPPIVKNYKSFSVHNSAALLLRWTMSGEFNTFFPFSTNHDWFMNPPPPPPPPAAQRLKCGNAMLQRLFGWFHILKWPIMHRPPPLKCRRAESFEMSSRTGRHPLQLPTFSFVTRRFYCSSSSSSSSSSKM